MNLEARQVPQALQRALADSERLGALVRNNGEVAGEAAGPDEECGLARANAALPPLPRIDEPGASFEIELPVKGSGSDTVRVSTNYYYCQKADEGVCKVGAVVFTVPLVVSNTAPESVVALKYSAAE